MNFWEWARTQPDDWVKYGGDLPVRLPSDTALSDWDESKHPREEHSGRFTAGGGDGSTPESHERAERASATYKPSTKEKQQWAEKNQAVVARMIGGTSTDDNDPVDVTVTIGGHAHGVEVKTFLDNDNDKVTMHPDSRERKEHWGHSAHASLHTIVLDDRNRFGAGNWSGHRIYYASGVGAFRLGAMTPVKNAAHLRELMTAGHRLAEQDTSMSYFAVDDHGYLGDVASIGGLAAFRAWAETSGGMIARFAREGTTDDPAGLAVALDAATATGGVASVKAGIAALARLADGTLAITDGTSGEGEE